MKKKRGREKERAGPFLLFFTNFFLFSIECSVYKFLAFPEKREFFDQILITETSNID